MSWKTKNCYAEDVLKASSRHVLKAYWWPTNICWVRLGSQIQKFIYMEFWTGFSVFSSNLNDIHLQIYTVISWLFLKNCIIKSVCEFPKTELFRRFISMIFSTAILRNTYTFTISSLNPHKFLVNQSNFETCKFTWLKKNRLLKYLNQSLYLTKNRLLLWKF